MVSPHGKLVPMPTVANGEPFVLDPTGLSIALPSEFGSGDRKIVGIVHESL